MADLEPSRKKIVDRVDPNQPIPPQTAPAPQQAQTAYGASEFNQAMYRDRKRRSTTRLGGIGQ